MLDEVISLDQFHRQFPRGLQDRKLSIGVRHDDVNSRDVNYPVAHPALGYENMARNRAHILDTTDTRNEILRHGGRFENAQLRLPNKRGGCCWSSPHVKAETDRLSASSAFQQLFTLSSAYQQSIVNDCNQRVNFSRGGFMRGD
jgi:hypothetical protein